MQIVAALFAEDLDVVPEPGPATRLDLLGIRFSRAADGPFPVRIEPHLFVILRCGPHDRPDAVLEVRYVRRPDSPDRDGEEVARNVQPVQVEPGRFAYRLVRAELAFAAPGTIEAHVTLDGGDPVVVPYTLLAAPGDGGGDGPTG